MRQLRCDISKFILHGLAVIAVLLFVAPLETAHSDVQADLAAELIEGHSSSDGHDDHGHQNDHSALEILQDHCDPRPDCSNSFVVFNSIGMTVATSGFHSLVGGVVNLSTGRITTRDIPPPKRFS